MLRPCGEKSCDRQVAEVRLGCPAGRPDAVSAYCDEHGGVLRALLEAAQDWNHVAPPEVGDAARVRLAGSARLHTPEAYLVVRQLPGSQGGVWVAFLGLGSHQVPVSNPHGSPSTRGGKAPNNRPRETRGLRSFPDLKSALAAGTDAWWLNLGIRIGQIERLRLEPLTADGFSWGLPVTPLDQPIVVLLEQDDHRSSWDVAVTLPRVAPEGLDAVNGLRPSGEIK